MRRLLATATVVLALATVPATSAGASNGTRPSPFNGVGRAALLTTDFNTGAFVIDGTALVRPLGPSAFHSEGGFTGPDTVAFTSTYTAADGSTRHVGVNGSAHLLQQRERDVQE